MTQPNGELEFNTVSETRTSDSEGPAKHFGNTEAGIAEKVREEVAHLPGINQHEIEFYAMTTVQEDDKGRMFVEDKQGMVRYFLEEGYVETTATHEERVAVANNNQRELAVSEMLPNQTTVGR